MNQATKQHLENEPSVYPATLDANIKKHLEELRLFALRNPVMFEHEFNRVQERAENQIHFDSIEKFKNTRIVVISAMLFYAPDNSEHGFLWQVTASVALRATKKILRLAAVHKDERDQLLAAREQIITLIADRGFAPDFQTQEKMFISNCEVSTLEFGQIFRNLTEEQEQFYSADFYTPERVEARRVRLRGRRGF